MNVFKISAFNRIVLLIITVLTFGCKAESDQPERPNIILIMADDMGFSDIGCYGGEIQTPHLDQLAEQGIRFTQFYNGARCCPTRASLLTGLAPHQAGMGWMTIRDLGHEGYTGELNQRCRTIAEVLRDAGYNTYMSGKWHLTQDAHAIHENNQISWPLQRGFDGFFGTILGAGSFYQPASLVEQNEFVSPDSGFFYTDEIASRAIGFLESQDQQEDPFFLYMAYTAPHWPLHARDSTLQKYKLLYSQGWDELREQRFERMLELGLADSAWQMSERNNEAPAWDQLGELEKRDMAIRMATYAAQIDEMDQSIGRLLTFLDERGQLDNTMILFLADNGGCAEFISSGSDTTTEAIGRPESFESYRLPWANASNTPFRMFKHWTHEGGISTPLIVHWPGGGLKRGSIIDVPAQVNDIIPTLLEAGNADYPGFSAGDSIYKLEGISLIPVLIGESIPDRILFWEHEANRAVRHGKWKAVSKANFEYPFIQEWELYNLELDRTETSNLALVYPEIVEELAGQWDSWAESHDVLPLDGREWDLRLNQAVIYDTSRKYIGDK